jgi:hypothetical protein
VYTTYKGFGSIRKKPEIYALPLKRRPGPGDRSMEAVMDRMPDIEEKIVEDGKEIPWYEGKNVHWYIIGGQHTVESFRKIASEEPAGSVQRKELLKFQNIELGRAKWIEGGSPMPHHGGGKVPQLEVHSACILDPFIFYLFLTSLWPPTMFLSANSRYRVCKKSRCQSLLTLSVRAQ